MKEVLLVTAGYLFSSCDVSIEEKEENI